MRQQYAQIALGVLNFESALRYLPPGGTTCVDIAEDNGSRMQSWWVSGSQHGAMCYGPNWALQLHSFIEEGALSTLVQKANEDQTITQRANPMDTWDMQDKGARQWRPFHDGVSSSMRCPSAGLDLVPFNDGDDDTSGTGLGHLSRAHYVVCFGGGTMFHAVPERSKFPVLPAEDRKLGGMFGLEQIRKFPEGNRIGRGKKISKIRDGMSKTLMLSEVLTWNQLNAQGIPEDDRVPQGNDDWRGVWIIPSVGASAFTGFTTPNSEMEDVIPACGTRIEASAAARSMPCREESGSANIYAAARTRPYRRCQHGKRRRIGRLCSRRYRSTGLER